MNDLVIREASGPVLRLTLNDPATRNSLSERMMGALSEAIGSSSAKAIIIASQGPAFSSGHNLKEITARRADPDKGAGYFRTLFEKCADLMMLIARHPAAVIAEVDGLASAAGCQLVATCDLAVATDKSTFCTPGVNIGLFCSTPMVALTRAVNRKHAMEMLLTGDVFSAEDALRMGLVNRVVSHNELKAVTQGLAEKIASKSNTAVKIGKQAFDEQISMPLPDAYAYMAKVMAENMVMAEAREGIGAFIEKRHPQWGNSD